MNFSNQGHALGDVFKRFFKPEAPTWGGIKEGAGTVEFEERWAVWIAFGSLVAGLIAGFYSVMPGLGLILLGFTIGTVLRLDAVFGRRAMNQRKMIELQQETVRELCALNAGERYKY